MFLVVEYIEFRYQTVISIKIAKFKKKKKNTLDDLSGINYPLKTVSYSSA